MECADCFTRGVNLGASRCAATINQIHAFLIEQGITIRKGHHALRNSLLAVLHERRDEITAIGKGSRMLALQG